MVGTKKSGYGVEGYFAPNNDFKLNRRRQGADNKGLGGKKGNWVTMLEKKGKAIPAAGYYAHIDDWSKHYPANSGKIMPYDR